MYPCIVTNVYNQAVNMEFAAMASELRSSCVTSLSGIPLTEEWLLKFGFVQYLLIWRYKGFTIASSLNNGYGLTGYCIENIFPINCLYVHQLQNLYFALTNEELTIK